MALSAISFVSLLTISLLLSLLPQVVLATISGKIRKNYVRIVVGDSVELDLSAYDLTRGRITFRNK